MPQHGGDSKLGARYRDRICPLRKAGDIGGELNQVPSLLSSGRGRLLLGFVGNGVQHSLWGETEKATVFSYGRKLPGALGACWAISWKESVQRGHQLVHPDSLYP